MPLVDLEPGQLIRCGQCQADVSVRLHGYRCPVCGYSLPKPDVLKKPKRKRTRKDRSKSAKARAYWRNVYKYVLRHDPCSYCGRLFPYPPKSKVIRLNDGNRLQTIDHIDPQSKGGQDTWDNYTAACDLCNRLKSDESLLFALLGFAESSKDTGS